MDFFNKFVNPALKKEWTFIEKLSELRDKREFTVSDPMHFYKNGRTHMLQHPLCLDMEKMICVNMTEFEKAVLLGPVISDRSPIGAMKDSVILSLSKFWFIDFHYYTRATDFDVFILNHGWNKIFKFFKITAWSLVWNSSNIT